jgi:SAM-dependent methyltransferase
MRPNLYDDTAHLYDFGNSRDSIAEDVGFYCSMIPPTARVLEVGCGTGRVGLALATRGNRVTGVDLSEAMLRVFRQKLSRAESEDLRIRIECMDMRSFDLRESFDWILFPFRVFQALTSDDDRRACLAAVKTHLAAEGRAVLSLFNPRKDVLDAWGRKGILDFEGVDEATGRAVKRYQDQLWHDAERQIIATHLRYEVYEGGVLTQSLTDDLELGYLYPEQCLRLFLEAGMRVDRSFGGYDGRALCPEERNEQIYVLAVE